MTAFSPSQAVAALGLRAQKAVALCSAGGEITPATVRAASDELWTKAPRIAKQLRYLAANWSLNHKGTRYAA